MKLALNIKNLKNCYRLSLQSKRMGKDIGSCEILKRTYKIKGKNFYYLSKLFMKEKNKGYGSILMRKTQSWCSRKKSGIMLCAAAYPLENHKKLIKFYTRLNFTYLGFRNLGKYKPNRNVMIWISK